MSLNTTLRESHLFIVQGAYASQLDLVQPAATRDDLVVHSRQVECETHPRRHL